MGSLSLRVDRRLASPDNTAQPSKTSHRLADFFGKIARSLRLPSAKEAKGKRGAFLACSAQEKVNNGC
jgi:hypothetical protein